MQNKTDNENVHKNKRGNQKPVPTLDYSVNGNNGKSYIYAHKKNYIKKQLLLVIQN